MQCRISASLQLSPTKLKQPVDFKMSAVGRPKTLLPVAFTGRETQGFKLQRAPFLYALSRPFNCGSLKRVNRQKRLRRGASDD
jgi:hypothetical protein